MKEVRDLDDLTTHEVQPIRDKETTGRNGIVHPARGVPSRRGLGPQPYSTRSRASTLQAYLAHEK